MPAAGKIDAADMALPVQPDPSHPPLHPEGPEGRYYKIEKKTLVWSGLDPQGASRAVYKMYRFRGAISWQRERSFRFRVQREYDACAFLARKGIPTTPPLGWFYGESADHGRYEVLVMTELPEAVPLLDLIKAGRSDEIDFEALFQLLREMHGAGFFHGRLDMRNILGVPREDGAGLDFVIMDTPQAMLFKRDLFGTRMAAYDMRQVSYYTHDYLSAERCVALLKIYGFTEAEAQHILLLVQSGPIPKNTKNMCRFEFGLRSRVG